MADIFREVDEELRRENLEKLWKKYGRALIGLAVAIILVVAGLQAWQAYERNRRQDLSDRFSAALALAAADRSAGLAALAEMSEADGAGYAGLAAFQEARLRAATGDVEGAVSLWDRIAANGGLGPGFRAVATLLSVMHQIDSGDPAALRARLEPLSGAGEPFRASAIELLALIALRQGDAKGAKDLYARISDDPAAPSGLRARAAQMIAAIEG